MEFAEFQRQYGFAALDEQQCAAVQAVQGPVLLLAVPGSGKTTTLLARLGYLILGCGVRPGQVLTCTYTVAATREMQSRFAEHFGPQLAGQVEFRTINGVCARIIGLYERTGHRAFQLVTDEAQLRGILRQIWLDTVHSFPTEGDLRSIAGAISYAKNRMLTPEQTDELTLHTGEGQLSAGPFAKRYNDILRQNGWMDYDDQLRYAYAILRREPAILDRLQRRWQHFCVDEAQDTSLIQHRILALLAERSRSLMMVGDEDQSIYGFRAACPEELLRFERDWPGARVLLMEHNYRSTPQIVAAADRFIRLNSQRRAKTMRTDNAPGPEVTLMRCTTRLEQYEKLCRLAEQAHRDGTQTAILYRNNDTALPLIDTLSRRGLSYNARAVDGLFFTSRVLREVRDILAFAADPCDYPLFRRIYPALRLYLKRETVEALQPVPGVPVLKTVLDQAELPMATRTTIHCRTIQLSKLRAGCPAAGAIRCIAREMGYREYLEEKEIDPFRLDILQLLAERETTVQALLDRVDTLEALIRQGSTDSAAPVVLSTIHSSKGLEYDRVILADAIEGILPAAGRLKEEDRQKQIEEDRRLFYVGMTRARRQLTLASIGEESMPFVDFFDPRARPAPEQPVPPVPAALPAAVLTVAGEPDQPDLSLEEFVPGAAVSHRIFGRGILLRRDRDLADIVFEQAGEKRLSLPVAVRGGGLRAEPSQPPDPSKFT